MADETKPKDAKPKKEAKAPADKAEKPEKPKAAGKAASEGKAAAEGRPAAKAPEATPGAAPAAGEAAKPGAPAAGSAPTAAELLGDDAAAKKIIKAKGSKNIFAGVANILATFNNTTVSICDMHGNVIGWSCAGRVGFKGSRKSTAFAAQQDAQDAARQAMGHGL